MWVCKMEEGEDRQKETEMQKDKERTVNEEKDFWSGMTVIKVFTNLVIAKLLFKIVILI